VIGFFDNMGNWPIREPEWRPYAIEGTVADDAENVAFGVMAMGAVTADFDAVELAARGTTGDWAPVAIQDAGFEAADAQKSGWLKTGSADAAISRPAAGAPQSGQYVRFAPVPVPAGAADAELFPEGDPAPGAHADVDLGAGLRARVPLVLTDAEARPNPGRQSDLDALRAALAALPGPAAAPDPDQRLADVVVAWNVLRHFYPYWTEAGVDWDAHLQPQLEMARGAETREAQRDAIRRLVADARDGHGLVLDTLDTTQRAELPVRLAVIEDRLVVVSSARPSEVGAVVSTIDGVPATERLARAVSLTSGTTQWRQVAGIRPLTSGPVGTTVRLGLDTGSGTQEVELTYLIPPPPVKRPGPVVAKEPGLWYVDLTRARMAQITWKLAAIAAARAVVFDVRGYPTDAGFGILPHLLDAPETDRWMHVAKIVGPFHETAGWQDEGWNVKPASPRIAGQVVFLTDGGAISYAESVMGYVADRKLGTIVGGPTAGTNGNVASFVTPGGFAVNFTGMRVTRHDGRSPHHLVGVRPDVPVAPTLEGLRAGRDEVLERGLAVAAARATAR
ncbi:MAG TPA: S41 family peptidase, partial [Vicinamibacteria bacterium]|nr:S41 family peptidase [Vicinamibacteria bacterium]